MRTEIILERHGESIGNAKRIYLGHTDLDLSERGRWQAEITAKHLADVKIDAVYSSDLKRAHNTVLPHAKMRGLEVVDSRNLREINIGNWECVPIDTLINEHYDDFVVGWKENFGSFAFPGGESVLDGAERFYNEVIRIARENEGKTVLIGSHAAVIRAFWCKINGVATEDMAKAYPFPTNASYSTLSFDGERFIPKEYSSDSHFQGESYENQNNT